MYTDCKSGKWKYIGQHYIKLHEEVTLLNLVYGALYKYAALIFTFCLHFTV